MLLRAIFMDRSLGSSNRILDRPMGLSLDRRAYRFVRTSSVFLIRGRRQLIFRLDLQSREVEVSAGQPRNFLSAWANRLRALALGR